MKLTRRQLAAALASAAAAQAQPAPAPAADAELQAAQDRLKNNCATLAKQDVPMSLEPAFQFKA